MNHTKKRPKRRRKPSSPATVPPPPPPPPPPEVVNQTLDEEEENDEERAISWLSEAFSSVSLDEIASAYRDAGGDAYKAAGVLGAKLEDPGEAEPVVGRKNVVGGRRKARRVAVATGLVSDVIGRGYPRNGGRGYCGDGRKGVGAKKQYSVEEAEEFLCSMLGGSDELGMGVVKDVLGQCGHDVEKALDALLDISASSSNQFKKSLLSLPQTKDRTSESTLHASEKEYDFLQSVGNARRDYACIPAGSEEQNLSRSEMKLDLQQKVLETLFSIPDCPEYDTKYMNWKKVVKKVESFGQGLEFRGADITEPSSNAMNGKLDFYQFLRSPAQKHYDMMKTCYKKAAMAYASGQRAHAAYLSELGKSSSKLASEADEKASREIFEARNKEIKNAVTIDLHGQHVKNAIGLLKLHLLLFTYIPSIRVLKVITGCGADGVGKGKIKRTVISLVEKEGIEWSEENPGTLVLQVDGAKQYSFINCDSDSEQN